MAYFSAQAIEGQGEATWEGEGTVPVSSTCEARASRKLRASTRGRIERKLVSRLRFSSG